LRNLPFVQMSAPVSIGQRFTQLIQHLGLSKNAFAQSLDKTATVIQHLVDERNKPGYDLLCKVFETYPNVSKDWLLLGQGPMMATDAATEPASLAASTIAPLPTVTMHVPAAAAVQEPVLPAATPVAAAPLAAPVAAPPAPAPAPAAQVPPVATPDPSYLTVALQTQYLQHQLALAEQRNQHLLEQQALMQQLVAVLQGR
jgi:plasmid maintenance system antidote protein VapI